MDRIRERETERHGQRERDGEMEEIRGREIESGNIESG